MKQLLVPLALMGVCALAAAKLPALDDAAKAKAAEATARTAWQGKVDAYLLCKAQDKVVAAYRKSAGAAGDPKAMAATAKADPKAAAGPADAQVVAPVPAASAAPTGPIVAVAAAAPPAPCVDAGPFAYNPPEQKPLEAAGAHSPSGTAASPPSNKPTAAEMAPARKP
ncbi:MAG TPA: hypothetical protein VLJ58_20245 [Ramlibacter sp.]|nr:hypothetical protein [Ramlibacter sp.]